MVDGVEETPEVENEDCAPCVGGFEKGEGEGAGMENKLDDDDDSNLEVDELENDSGLETVEASSFSFCIFR